MTTKALIVPNLMDVIDDYFHGFEGHRTDSRFIELCERINGKEVELVFRGGDAFEAIDNDFWLPPCCYTILEAQP